MPDIEGSLKIFGQLLGLLGPDGSIQWVWFSDPKLQILGKAGDATDGLAHHRQYLGQLIRTLKGGNAADPDADFADGYSWVPLNDGDIQVGFVWSKATPELQFGFGSQANFTAGSQKIDLAVLAKFLKIQDGTITPLIGDVLFSGAFPVPTFLKSMALKGETMPPSVEIDVTDKTGGAAASRALKFSSTTLSSPANGATFAWDCGRIALFVLEAWIHDHASGGDNAFTRMDHHLFPMFGEPAQPHISPFPLFGQPNMGKPANFQPWRDSVLNMSGGGAGALAFLWHLRALLTGNEKSDFLKGSLFMPLVSGAQGGAPPFDPAAFTGSYDPTTINTPSVYIGITDTASVYTLCLDIVAGNHVGTANNYLRIPLAQLSGTTLSRPNPPSAAALNTFLSAALPAQSGVKVGKVGAAWALSFTQQLDGTGIAFLDGTYQFDAILESPIRFQVTSANLPVTISLPPESAPAPPTPAALIAAFTKWVIAAIPKGAPGDPSTKIAAIAGDLADFIAAEIKTPGSGDIAKLLFSIGKALADGLKFEVKQPPFDFNVALSQGNTTNDKFFHVTSGVSYGPLTLDQIPNFPISIGKLSATVDLAVDRPGNPLWGFSLGFDDLRLGDAKGGASGLIASLIPNLKEAPGFTFKFDWSIGKGVQISGGGKIPIQLTLGPLSLSQLMVSATNTSLTIGINLTFQLAVITISTYELGLGFDFKTNLPKPVLHGLGLSFNGAGIKLSGLFLENNGDYIGAAAVSIEDMFALSAIGGYKLLQQAGQSDTPSLFIFASLVAPLGGPPFFFMTGIAGGFGFNRTLPPMTLMSKHPFIQVMNGDIQIPSDPKTGMGALTALDDPKTGFAPKAGDYWIAAGIQFVSFGFINGKVLISVAFGHDFSLNLLGIASFGLKPVAYFEIDILVTVDKEKFLLIAGVSPNSYLIHPDIFSLQGDFGLGVWHSGPHQGDFLVSIGGFHPYFKTPDYYPVLNRVSVKAEVWGFVHLAIECFFACTPQALMAGASVSLSATFAGIGAGLDVYIDVLIQWDPFFILATMGVTVWFEFMGRHEIGVDLQIHTPPFGGTATIHLFIVSFDISFGSDLQGPPPPPVFEFITKRLGVPAKAWSANGAALALFNSDQAAGLVRVLFTSGRTTSDQADGTKAQEGTDPKNPVKVSPEFSFLVRTHLPFLESDGDLNSPPVTSLAGTVNLPLCSEADLSSTLTVKLFNATESHNISVPSSDIARSADFFPYANFSHDALPAAQADKDSARQAVASIDTTHPAIALTDGFSFNLVAQPQPPTQTQMAGPEEQLSDVKENYPLPLGWPPSIPPITVANKSRLQFAANSKVAPRAAQLKPKAAADRRQSALQQMKQRTHAPWQVGVMSAQVNRTVRASAMQTTSVAAPPAGVPVMAPPPSPQRRAELAPVTLRVLAAHTTAAAQITLPLRPIAALRAFQPAHTILATDVAAAIRVPGTPPTSSISVVSGHAAHLNISGNSTAPQGSLNFTGTQTVRAVFLTSFGEPVADQYIAGNQRVALPPRARRVLLVGEGALTGAPASLGSIGVEPASALFAISRKEFAGHGCVLRSKTPLLTNFDAGHTLTGADVLPAGSSFTVFFPAPPKPSALLITVAPAVPNPASAPSQVRWRAVSATLTGLNITSTPDRAAFVMDVQAAAAWSLDIETGSDWQLTSAVLCDMASADVLTALRTDSNWNFVDDRFLEPASPATTSVTLELANG